MLGRFATTVIPAVTIGVTAIVLLGPGRQREAIGVRVWGSPAEGSDAVAYRLEGVRRAVGVDDAVEIRGLRLEARDAEGVVGEWSGDTGPDGVAEAVLKTTRPLKGTVELRVARGDAVVCEGRVALERIAPPTIAPAKIPATAKTGEASVEVDVVRGALVSPFEDAVRVSFAGAVSSPGAVEPGADPRSVYADPSIVGAEVRPKRSFAGAKGQAIILVKPLAHMVELSLNVSAGEGKAGRWEGILPVVPGGIWLEPARAVNARGLESQELRVISPSPRSRVYLSMVSDQGRVFGAVVPLEPDASGFFAGRVRLTFPPGARTLQAVLAGDPFEQGAGTVAWPLIPPEGTAEIRRVQLLIDGLPAVEAREKARASGARRAAALLVGAAAIFEVLLLVLRGRASQRALDKHLAKASGQSEGEGEAAKGGPAPLSPADRAHLLASARDNPVLWTLALAALVALGFALVLALATLR